ncbi:hypothetical protein EI94DRAFT_1746041 [Lactarius quietus]|nr:hypothetical protein EI94DRAFT_1746041 [Lactarius quietus]
MSLQTFGKGALRVAKNYTKGYSDVQAKVREATSNDPWGPSGTQMNEIAQMTYNQNDFVEIMKMLDKRLNDKGKNWRHVFKCLVVLDYLLHAGSENVVFQYVDEYGIDQGANVRQKAKDITNLLTDEARLPQDRLSRANMRDRMLGQPPEEGDDEPFVLQGAENDVRRANAAGGDGDLRHAIEESKAALSAEQACRVEEADLARAIKFSEEEETRQRASLADSGSAFSTAPPLEEITYSPLERLALSIEGLIASTGGTLTPDANEMLTSWPKLKRCLIQADIHTDL